LSVRNFEKYKNKRGIIEKSAENMLKSVQKAIRKGEKRGW